jgi:hypothetical protein
MKNFYISCFISMLLLCGVSHAQESDTTYWKSGGLSSITFSQVSLSNWAAGGENSVSLNGFFQYFADYEKGRNKWQNTLDVGYGLLKQGDARVQKSDDKINYVTKWGYRIQEDNEKWFFTTLLDFRTQFAEGFSPENPDSVISRFFSPAYLTIGTGIEYTPNAFLSFSYIPVTGKLTFVSDNDILGDTGAYGVQAGRNMRAELGSYLRLLYKQEAFKNVNIDTRLELFTNYQKNTFGNIDVNWQNTIVMKINRYMSTNLFTQLLYDDDIKTVESTPDGERISGPRVQFKSVFGVGITYEFGYQRPEE